jgi:hypothetical protein
MATTTNYSWTTPDDTDLVKDGAAAIRTLGSSIDTTVFANAGNAINKTIVDAKGDLIAATAADTVARLAVGTNGQYLAANSATATGLEWQTVSAGGMTSIASGTLSGASVSITSIPGTYNEIWLYVNAVDLSDDDTWTYVQFNSVTSGSKYFEWASGTATATGGGNADSLGLIRASDNAVTTSSALLRLVNYNTTNSHKLGQSISVGIDKTTTTTLLPNSMNHLFNSPSAAITSIQIFPQAGTFQGGTYALYGVK